MAQQPLRLAILAYPGSLQSAVLGLQDLLGHAAGLSERPCSIEAVQSFEDCGSSYDAVILPPAIADITGGDVKAVGGYIADQHRNGAVVCSACAGIMFVAEAGLAQGRRVTTHWGLEQRLQQHYPDLAVDTDPLLIEYGDLITAGGLMAWIDLGLAVIERFMGYGVAARTAGFFIVDMRRRDQRRFRRFTPNLRHGDAAILKAQRMMEAGYADPLNIKDIASRAGLPARTFLRRFKARTGVAPSVYLQELRVERACDLLIETRQSVAGICYAVGYQDPPSFVRLFTRVSGLTPTAFRKHFARERA